MGSLPPARANIGSAVNDTARELGGALGVAVVGSIMSSLYATQLAEGLPEREAVVHAMSRASIVAALAAAIGAYVAWRHLPARGGVPAHDSSAQAVSLMSSSP
jgi:hypothetical protein